MTKIIVAQDAPVLAAIDIAKARHEVLIAMPDKKRRLSGISAHGTV